jgi:V/A-type H+-transporting ATPase subunit I
MIVPMSRITLLCTAAARDRALADLRELGVLHIEPLNPHAAVDLDAAQRQLDRTQAVAAALPSDGAGSPSGRKAYEIVDDVLKLIEQHRGLKERVNHLADECIRLQPLGKFNPADIGLLRGNGIIVKAYRMRADAEFETPEGVSVVALSKDQNQAYFAAFGRRDFQLEGAEVALPSADSAVEHQLEEARVAIAACEESLAGFSGERPVVVARQHELEDEVQLLHVQSGMDSHGNVLMLGGYCPKESVAELQKASAEKGWGLLVREPEAGDKVPTWIRHPTWVKPIKSVLDFIGVMPGYKEVDISACFLIFFSIFFAMIVGDAGYGIIFLGLTLICSKLLPKQPKSLWALLALMSTCTVIWGVVTGMWFGIKALPPLLEAGKIDWLTNENKDDNLMYLCFLIGAIHLTLAHAWNVIRVINTPQALAQVGWIMTTWTMFLLACSMVLSMPFPPIGYYLLVGGVVLIVLFMTPIKRMKAEWFNFIMFPLDLVSNFVDVVSYVRLFAVGMATFAIADAVNTMALDIGFSGILSGLFAGVILLFGHALNIALAAMGVLVHGVRLNTLEFSGHLGMEWTGQRYDPLARCDRGTE